MEPRDRTFSWNLQQASCDFQCDIILSDFVMVLLSYQKQYHSRDSCRGKGNGCTTSKLWQLFVARDAVNCMWLQVNLWNLPQAVGLLLPQTLNNLLGEKLWTIFSSLTTSGCYYEFQDGGPKICNNWIHLWENRFHAAWNTVAHLIKVKKTSEYFLWLDCPLLYIYNAFQKYSNTLLAKWLLGFYLIDQHSAY